MKSYRKELWFNIPGRRGFINITPEVQLALRESGVKEGLVLVNASHSQCRLWDSPLGSSPLKPLLNFLISPSHLPARLVT